MFDRDVLNGWVHACIVFIYVRVYDDSLHLCLGALDQSFTYIYPRTHKPTRTTHPPTPSTGHKALARRGQSVQEVFFTGTIDQASLQAALDAATKKELGEQAH